MAARKTARPAAPAKGARNPRAQPAKPPANVVATDRVGDVDQNKPHASAPGEEPLEGSVMEQRVAHIVELKLRLRYKRRTAERLAEEWGVSVGYVHVLSSRANTVVRKAAVDPDALAAELVPELMATYRTSCRLVRGKRGFLGDKAKMAASVASMGALIADLGGLKAPKVTKNEHSGPEGGPMQLTPFIFLPEESDD